MESAGQVKRVLPLAYQGEWGLVIIMLQFILECRAFGELPVFAITMNAAVNIFVKNKNTFNLKMIKECPQVA